MGYKTPTHFEATFIIKLMDVRLRTIVDPVSPSGGAPDDVKVGLGIKLFELGRRKPGA